MGVLATKLSVPRVRRRLVGRPRLVEKLSLGETWLPRLVLVSAPPGFGKTTFLSQWLAGESGTAVAWLSLDERDNDLRRFLTHLVAAVHTLGEDVGVEAERLMEATDAVPAEAVLTSVVNELDQFAGQAVLALDDYHVLVEPTVHEVVAFLLEHAPPQVSIAVATRADPPLPLARLRSRGELVELRASDLRFTPAEADTFLNELMALDLAPAQVAALDARTEGWATGLQLAALSLGGQADAAAFVDAFAGSNRFVLDYLVEEVMHRQPEAVRRFLLDTAVLAQLNGPLCDAVTGRNDSSSTLENLERGNLFLVSLDEERQWFRYHHLFADALRARLRSEDPDRVPRLHRSASQWYADHDLLEDAIGHAIAGGHFELAADLIELALPEARRHRQDRMVRSWLNAVPDEVVRQRAVLSVQVAWIRLVEGDLEGVERRLLDAEQILAASDTSSMSGSAELPAMIEVYRAMVVSSATTTEWVIRNAAKGVMAALALVGITGLYLRQVRQAGLLGLIGYLLFGLGYLFIFGVEIIASSVLPALTDIAPGYVNDVLVAAAGGSPAGDIGGLQTVFDLNGFAFVAGGVLFGVALFRARILARWAAALLALGTGATLALAVLPESFNRPIAIPTGIALIGLGISLWRDQRKPAEQATSTPVASEQSALR